ncbi:MAG: hypothetical protein LBF94_02870, partial [Puniceicoccales bacterium]|nr:hypothetical protein [Puniceicoccales bacterium]
FSFINHMVIAKSRLSVCHHNVKLIPLTLSLGMIPLLSLFCQYSFTFMTLGSFIVSNSAIHLS